MKNNRFRELRLSYKPNGVPLSQRKLAPVLDIAATHISEIESGRMPSINELKKYHDFFRVSYEYLLGETEDLVSTDIFRKKPRTETKLQNTLRWLNETTEKDEIKIRETVNMLLATDRGLLLLFYLTNALEFEENTEELLRCIKNINDSKYEKMSYAELRIIFDKDN